MSKKKLNTNIHRIFKTNKLLEDDGAWVDINELTNSKVKIRRAKSEAVQKAYQRILREEIGEANLRNPGAVTKEAAEKIAIRQIAEAIIVDWQIYDVDTGEDIPFDIDTAKELLAIDDFREFVVQAAQDRDTFKDKNDRDAEGN